MLDQANREQPGPPPPGEPPEENEAAWERVLDCGAPGPSRAEPALFYQAGRPAGAAERQDPA